MEVGKPERLLSLDTLRGFDMFWIIGGETIFHTLKNYTGFPLFVWMSNQLDHVEWNGFHFYDLIFPLFLFLSGVAMPYSLSRQVEKGIPKNKIYLKVLRRAALLVLFGVFYNGQRDWNLQNLRYASVLGQIGIAYFFAAIIFLNSNWKQQIYWIGGILIGYWAIQNFIPVPGYGAGVLTKEGSINGFIDRALMPGRLYLGIHDPEGWLVKISATATVLMGALTGSFLKNKKIDGYTKIGYLLITAGSLLLLSLLLNFIYPINKNLWTGSFALHTAGWSILLLTIFYLVIDVLDFKKWAFFFVVIGMNSITVYLASSLVDYSHTVKKIFGGIIPLFDTGIQPAIFACCVIAIEWALLYFLYKKKIFMKV